MKQNGRDVVLGAKRKTEGEEQAMRIVPVCLDDDAVKHGVWPVPSKPLLLCPRGPFRWAWHWSRKVVRVLEEREIRLMPL
jgi:hypothetical protein